MKKTVWIVNEYNGPDGIRTRQTILSQRLEERGYTVYLICGSAKNKGGSNAIEDGVPYRYVESDGAKYYVVRTSNYQKSYERVLVALQFQNRLWKIRDKLPKPDVIVSDFAGLFGNVFLKWKKKYGTRIIYDVLDLWPEGFVEMGYLRRDSIITKVLYGMEHKSYRDADGIIFSMQGGRKYIVEKGWSKEEGGDVDTSDIGYLNNGVDLETLEKQKKEYVLKDTDLDTDKFKVVYLGSISSMNGIEVLVDTAKELQRRGNNKIVILVYGFGNKEEELKQLVEREKIKNMIFKGKLDKRYAMSLLTRSDLNIFTFKNCNLWRYGISPNKLFMYFASGKPILSMIKPEYDLVEEKQAGISVDNDPCVVADAIEHFCTIDKEQYNLYCRNSYLTANEYDYKNLVQVLINKIEG